MENIKPIIKEVSFNRKFNLGNYGTMDIGLTATIVEGQSVSETLKALDKYTIQYRKMHSEIQKITDEQQ
jgi:hypothetical protein